jgi:hypothetical protein
MRRCAASLKGAKSRRQMHPPKSPPKTVARILANQAERQGKIVPEPCWCGSWDVEKHHPDYSKPLDVVWLCHACHATMHGGSFRPKMP